MTRTIYIFVCGILTFPGGARNWTGRAVTWTHIHTRHPAEKVEYFTGIVSRLLGQRRRADKLAKTLSYYEGWRRVVVAHSNGANVVIKALRRHPDLHISRLFLVGAACHASFEKNGLNRFMGERRVGPVTVFWSPMDAALKWARLGGLLGYGQLGLVGPKDVETTLPVSDIKRYAGHGEWFDGGYFDQFMERVTRS